MLHSHRPSQRKVRIGFDATRLAEINRSGVGYYLHGFITALAQQYPNEIELVGHYYVSKSVSKFQLAKAPNIKYKTTRFIPLKLVNFLRRIGIEIPFELLIKHKFDFLIFPSYLNYPSLFKTPSTVVIHDLAYMDMPDTVSARNRLDLVRFVPRTIKRSKFLTTISEATKQRILEIYKPTAPIIITPIPPASPLPVSNPDDTLKILGVQGSYILFVGTLEPRKNLAILIDAYSSLPDKLKGSYDLVLAGGDGWNNTELKLLIKRSRKRGLRIITPGYVSEQQRAVLFANATIFVMPSLYEGFGMPLLESMSYNTPVLASDLPVFHEVCGNAAIYFNPNNTEELTSKIEALLINPERTKALVTLGQINLSKYSWEAIAKKVLKQIQGSIDENRR